MGLGKSGFAAAKFLKNHGAQVRVTESSEKKETLENADFLKNLGVLVETGCHTEGFIKGSELVVTSPGVSKKSLPLNTAKKLKIPVISEIELASYFCLGPQAAITGSNGKTTTCHLVHRILREAKRKSVLCGNVGVPFLEEIPRIDKNTTTVIELSSFQLEDCPAFHPKIAVVLNVSPNHLDRHRNMKSYILAKEKIFLNQKKSDYLILNHDNAIVRAMARKARSKIIFFSKTPIPRGIFVRDGKIVVREGRRETVYLDSQNFGLKGEHNLENILAASAVAWILKIPAKSLQKTLNSFRTLEHRIESLGVLKGIHFVNDSKSTTIASTKAAILAVNGPLVLIAGGRDKGADFEEIQPLLKNKVKKAVLYGEAREKIAGAWRSFGDHQSVKNFKEAVRLAFRLASTGDSILLSPMCASFDQFSCFEERGEAFKEIFKMLKSEEASRRRPRPLS